MINEEDRKKISDFVTHLLSNPNIEGEPILVGETLIINFITKNLKSLQETFKTPQFFPYLEWEEVLQNILLDLRERVLKLVLPDLIDYINTSINFSVLNKVTGAEAVGVQFFKEKFLDFVKAIMVHKDVRFHFNSVLNIFKYNILEKYLNDIFKRREFIYNELAKVQRLNLKTDEHIEYLKILLLIKNGAYVRIPIDSNSGQKKINIEMANKAPQILKVFIEKSVDGIKKDLVSVDEKVIKMAIKANLSDEHTELEESSARFLKIMTERFQDYKPNIKVDRGAETPDKSWFNIARKNADYYGLNKRMLEELYRVAGDNNW